MQNVNASIITIGDELLIGQTIDTNSAWMAQELNKIGIWVKRRVAVGDVWDDIWKALDEESKESEVILITGGLGPTADDITKPLLCKYFGGQMIVNEKVLQFVKEIFTQLKRPMLERNLKQAEVPDVCTILHNSRGTAPGMLFRKDGRLFISLPGVPYEMKGLIADEVLPLLKKEFILPAIVHKTLFTAGQGESFIAESIKDFEASLPSQIKLAYMPAYGMVRLRLTLTGENKEKAERAVQPYFEKLKELVREILVTDEDEDLPITIGKILKMKRKTLATAESCTGGYIAHLITSVAGASDYYKGSVVSYANETKENILGVKNETLAKTGAVSEEVVIQMVKGTLYELNTDYAIATSGIMGPGGGSEEKPVGTVWVAVGNNNKIESRKFLFRFDRERNIIQTSLTALNILRKFIQEN